MPLGAASQTPGELFVSFGGSSCFGVPHVWSVDMKGSQKNNAPYGAPLFWQLLKVTCLVSQRATRKSPSSDTFFCF